MTNLAIECSGTSGSVALFEREVPLALVDLPAYRSSVQTLAVEIDRILQHAPRPTFISVTNGPGSFTGLRVGLTTAKMLAMAWNVPVVPVDTLQAIPLRAWRTTPAPGRDGTLIAVLNAFRGQVFATAVQWQNSETQLVLAKSCVLQAEAWRADPLGTLGLKSSLKNAILSGPGLKTYPLLEPAAGLASVQVCPPEYWNPTAYEVALLGQAGFDRGTATTAFALEPNYIRASAAEEMASQARP